MKHGKTILGVGRIDILRKPAAGLWWVPLGIFMLRRQHLELCHGIMGVAIAYGVLRLKVQPWVPFSRVGTYYCWYIPCMDDVDSCRYLLVIEKDRKQTLHWYPSFNHHPRAGIILSAEDSIPESFDFRRMIAYASLCNFTKYCRKLRGFLYEHPLVSRTCMSANVRSFCALVEISWVVPKALSYEESFLS